MKEADLLAKALGSVERLPVNSFSPSEFTETIRDTLKSLEAQPLMSVPNPQLIACCLYNNGILNALLSIADRVALKDIATRAVEKYSAMINTNQTAATVTCELAHQAGRF